MDKLLTVDEVLEGLPVKVAERRFREAARSLRLNILDGRQMMVKESNVEKILQAMTPCCESQSGPVPRSGRSSARLVLNASDRAVALLTKLPPKPKHRTSKDA